MSTTTTRGKMNFFLRDSHSVRRDARRQSTLLVSFDKELTRFQRPTLARRLSPVDGIPVGKVPPLLPLL